MKLNYGRTFTLGLGFFVISITWSLYNSYMPIFYKRYVESTALIGAIMTLDNIAALTLQPYFGALSDRVLTRVGRRMNFLLVGMPLGALFFSLIPLAGGFPVLLGFTLMMNLGMSIYRTPTIALMPDLTPSPLRSKANGVINFMGGLGALLAFFAGSKLYRADHRLPFWLTSILALIVLGVLCRFIKEPERPVVETREETGIFKAFREVLNDRDRSALMLLLAILFWFIGYAGVEAMFTLYGKYYLGITEDAASFTMGFISLSFLVFAIPSGFVATRIGRRATIMTGIAGICAAFAALIFIHQLALIRIVFLFTGFFWALININSYPMVVEMTTSSQIGAYTGLYYVFSSLANIAGPPLFGFLIDAAGYQVLFAVALVSFAIAFLCMNGVKRGEALASGRAVGV